MATQLRPHHLFNGRHLLILALFAAGMLAAGSPALAADYDSLAIIAPVDDETVHDNSGHLHVDAVLSPPLRPADRLVLVLDGTRLPPTRQGPWTLADLDRGSHTLQVEVIDSDGHTLIRSAPRTLYMWRASALFPGRGGH